MAFHLVFAVTREERTHELQCTCWSIHLEDQVARGSMIVGKSIHNQRIERLWRDVFQGALKFYYGSFYHLESMPVPWILIVTSISFAYCLHYVHAPRINQHLSMWKDAWNMHPLRTESNHTPLQLWTRGLLARSAQDLHDMDDELLDEVVFHLHVNVCMCMSFACISVDYS